MGAMLTEAEMDEMAYRTHARMEHYRKNEIISLKNRGQTPFFCVREGLVYLCAENEAYEKSILRVFRAGECFVENMVLDLTQGVSYLSAKYPSQVMCVSQTELRSLCAAHTRWRERIERLFTQEMPHSLIAHSYILHQKTLRMKLMYYFKHERTIQRSEQLQLPMPFSDLADYLNVDRSAMMKEITRMKREGVLTGTRRNVVLAEKPD